MKRPKNGAFFFFQMWYRVWIFKPVDGLNIEILKRLKYEKDWEEKSEKTNKQTHKLELFKMNKKAKLRITP